MKNKEQNNYKINEKRIILNMTTSLTATILNSVLSFILMIFLIDSIGEEGNGIFQTLTSLYSYLLLAEGGISAIFMQKTYKHISKGDTEGVNQILSRYKKIYRKLFIPYILIGSAIAFGYPAVANSDDVTYIYMAILLLILFARKIYFILFSASTNLLVNLVERSYVRDILSIIFLCSSNIFIIFMLMTQNFSVQNTLLYVFIIYLGRYLLEQISLHTYGKKIKWFNPNIKNPKKVKLDDLKYQYASVVSGLIVNSTDTITISIMLDFVRSSTYGIFNIVNISARAVVNPFINVMNVVIGKHIALNKARLSSFKILNFMSVNAAAFAFICLTMLTQAFIEQSFSGISGIKSSYAILFAMITLMAISTRPLSILLETTGKFKANSVVNSIEAFLNISLTITFIFILNDLAGAVIATIVTSILKYVLALIYCSRKIIVDDAKKVVITIVKTWIGPITSAIVIIYGIEVFEITLNMSSPVELIKMFILVPTLAAASLFVTSLIFDRKTAKEFYGYVPILNKIIK